jgi:hypothetical protein
VRREIDFGQLIEKGKPDDIRVATNEGGGGGDGNFWDLLRKRRRP